MDILIGTRNQYKATEMAYFLKDIKGIKIHFLNETKITVSVDEDEATLKANAEKKAVEISEQTSWYVLTSDGGVDIPALGSKWNILKNQRTVGENKSDKEKVKALLNLMEGLRGEDRRCSYQLALALAKNGRLLWSHQDISDVGYIIKKPDDSEIPPYRWMGHLWYYPKFKKTFNQMNEKERNEVRKQGDRIKEELQRFLEEIKKN
jgi:inosine/xanthosine triphosphate pyrophosphatase family protein